MRWWLIRIALALGFCGIPLLLPFYYPGAVVVWVVAAGLAWSQIGLNRNIARQIPSPPTESWIEESRKNVVRYTIISVMFLALTVGRVAVFLLFDV